MSDALNYDNAEEQEFIEYNYIKSVNVIKYNYKNSESKKSCITLELKKSTKQLDNIYYHSRTNPYKKISNIVGIVYGTRTTTFRRVNYCVPWLCASIILKTRTYDFQFNNYCELIWFLYYTSTKYGKNPSYGLPIKIRETCMNHTITLYETYVQYFRRIVNIIQYTKLHNIYNLVLEQYECPICLEMQKPCVITKQCNHIFCKKCFNKHVHFSNKCNSNIKCPLCRRILSDQRLRVKYFPRFDVNAFLSCDCPDELVLIWPGGPRGP